MGVLVFAQSITEFYTKACINIFCHEPCSKTWAYPCSKIGLSSFLVAKGYMPRATPAGAVAALPPSLPNPISLPSQSGGSTFPSPHLPLIGASSHIALSVCSPSTVGFTELHHPMLVMRAGSESWGGGAGWGSVDPGEAFLPPAASSPTLHPLLPFPSAPKLQDFPPFSLLAGKYIL